MNTCIFGQSLFKLLGVVVLKWSFVDGVTGVSLLLTVDAPAHRGLGLL